MKCTRYALWLTFKGSVVILASHMKKAKAPLSALLYCARRMVGECGNGKYGQMSFQIAGSPPKSLDNKLALS